MPKPTNQSELVRDMLIQSEVGKELTDEIDSPGIKRLHTWNNDKIIEFLTMVLKVRRKIIRFEWFLCNEFDGETNVRFPGVEYLYTKPRTEIASTLLNAFQVSNDIVGITWEPGKPYIKVARKEDIVDKKDLNTTIELTYIIEQW